MNIKAFTYHKRAEKYCDCQDCFGINTQNNRIAVSDGMSQSIFPQWWARILVDAFLETGQIPSDNLHQYQRDWQERVEKEIIRQEEEGGNPWLLRDLFADRSGAGATLCGFSWNKKEWECQCIGDTCLIKIKKDYSIEIITSQKGPFDNHPDYLDSFCNGRGAPIKAKGDFNLEAILIVTDPFAELFQKYQLDNNFIKALYTELSAINTQNDYVDLVERWRGKYDMHNDDSTIVILSKVNSIIVKNSSYVSLEELCLNENDTLNRKLLNNTISVNESLKNEIIKEFRNSTEKLLSLCEEEDRKSKTKIRKFVNSYLKPIIEIFYKK